jgi:hemoglobin/transferrin/lactoferrin receptor protein
MRASCNPGVTKFRLPWGSEVNIRGSSRANVVFLVDEIRLNTATDIGAQFGTVDPASVERVEILKCPISSLYGSGTMGGVVNVITRNGRFSHDPYAEGGLNLLYNFNSDGGSTYAYTAYNPLITISLRAGATGTSGHMRMADTIP